GPEVLRTSENLFLSPLCGGELAAERREKGSGVRKSHRAGHVVHLDLNLQGETSMIIVKVGGGPGIDYDALCADIAELHRSGAQIVLVHGGSHETNQLAEALGHPPRFVTSPSGFTSRYTDRRTLEIFMMAYAGKVNKLIV